MTSRANLVSLAAVLGFLGVAFGAFGAHGLRSRLSPEMLTVFETGVRYQMYHALALLGLGLWCNHQGMRVPVAAWSWIAGSILFSGSLYALALTGIKKLGAITPFGGVLFLVGWGVFAYRAWKTPS
jgi:uncharacterized membrane protein YgdD (TMEM256/DUF423 family)